MAKRNNEPMSGSDKAKVRVFFAELEGNNDSVQEALKTMVSAMSRPVRVITEPQVNGNPALLGQVDVESADALNQAEESETISEELAPQPSRKHRGTGKKFDRNAGLTLVPDLDFRPNEKQDFKKFLDDKRPKNDIEFALATVYYMQHMMLLPKIGPSHVMSAFKEAGKPIPGDLRQTIRNVKRSKIWLNFNDIEDVRTTTQGDNFVEHEMSNTE